MARDPDLCKPFGGICSGCGVQLFRNIDFLAPPKCLDCSRAAFKARFAVWLAKRRHRHSRYWDFEGVGSLYSAEATLRIEEDIRSAVANELGFEPTPLLDPDVSFVSQLGYDWGSAAVVENLDSPELSAGMRKCHWNSRAARIRKAA